MKYWFWKSTFFHFVFYFHFCAYNWWRFLVMYTLFKSDFFLTSSLYMCINIGLPSSASGLSFAIESLMFPCWNLRQEWGFYKKNLQFLQKSAILQKLESWGLGLWSSKQKTNKNAFQSKAYLPLANRKSNTYNLTWNDLDLGMTLT